MARWFYSNLNRAWNRWTMNNASILLSLGSSMNECTNVWRRKKAILLCWLWVVKSVNKEDDEIDSVHIKLFNWLFTLSRFSYSSAEGFYKFPSLLHPILPLFTLLRHHHSHKKRTVKHTDEKGNICEDQLLICKGNQLFITNFDFDFDTSISNFETDTFPLPNRSKDSQYVHVEHHHLCVWLWALCEGHRGRGEVWGRHLLWRRVSLCAACRGDCGCGGWLPWLHSAQYVLKSTYLHCLRHWVHPGWTRSIRRLSGKVVVMSLCFFFCFLFLELT